MVYNIFSNVYWWYSLSRFNIMNKYRIVVTEVCTYEVYADNEKDAISDKSNTMVLVDCKPISKDKIEIVKD